MQTSKTGRALVVALGLAGCSESTAPVGPPPPPQALPIDVPAGFTVDLFASGFELPTSIAFPPDGSNRLFVNELQLGRVRVVENGVLLPAPFLTVPTNTSGGFPVAGENGLLGIAFDPDYATNRYVYVTYATRDDTGAVGTVARYRDVDNEGRERTVLLDGIPGAEGHQIQSLGFGPDGRLYVSVGDAFRPQLVQDPGTFHGKILRMNPDGSIPADNPFPGSYTYALGLRNTFDLAFDASGTMYTADNGPAALDELNRIVRGGNYGWPQFLGETSVPGLEGPVHVWPEVVSPNGMTFYRGTQFPASYRGKLFLVLFGDTFSNGPSTRAKRVQTVDVSVDPPVLEDFAIYGFTGIGNPLDITEGPDGSLFLSDIFQGAIYRIRYTAG